MSEPFIAEIKMFGGNFAPQGYASCNGQLLSIAQNTALFSLLGTTFGGDGQVTFGLPNLQGRSPVHYGNAPGLPAVDLGEVIGQPSVTLTVNQMPGHNHTATGAINVVAAAGTVRSAVNAYLAGDAGGDANYAPQSTSPTGALASGAFTGQVAIAGGSQPFSTQSPALAVNFIIALEGIYPSRP
jgi:microcystin-dependent protein